MPKKKIGRMKCSEPNVMTQPKDIEAYDLAARAVREAKTVNVQLTVRKLKQILEMIEYFNETGLTTFNTKMIELELSRILRKIQ